MAVLLFAMTTAVMGCYLKETGPIDIPGRTPSGTSAPQPSATPAGEVIPSVDRQAELAEARAKNPDTVAWLYIPFSLSSRCFLIGSSLHAVLFCYFMLSMAFSAKLLSTSASKSTHCAFVSSPASVITVSSRSSAERAIMGAAFHASICR